MPIRPSLWIIVIASAWLACSATKDASPGKHHFGGSAPGDSLFFHMERTPCFGPCHAYVMDVYRSGHATFEGRLNTEHMGLHRTHVPAPLLEELLDNAQRTGFFDLREKYDAQVTDLPSTIIRVVADGKDKQVLGRYGYPEVFRQFALAADSLLLPLEWTPVAEKD